MFRQLSVSILALTTFASVISQPAQSATNTKKPSDRVSAASTVKTKTTLPANPTGSDEAGPGTGTGGGSGGASGGAGGSEVAKADPSDASDPMNAFQIPKNTRQIVVGITDTWSSNKAKLRRYTRKAGGWSAVDTESFPAVLGPKGLVWGRGLNPVPAKAISAAGGSGAKRLKREGDKRSPAGVFTFGKAYGYEQIWAARTKMEYVTVTPADLLIEDSSSEFYNTQIRLDRPASSEWELSQQMEQTDPSHRLEIVVGHNTPKPVPGGGSAILIHIWRQNGKQFTTGCTAIADANIETMLRWLDPTAHPLYVLLPRSEYLARQKAWGLPALGEGFGTASATETNE